MKEDRNKPNPNYVKSDGAVAFIDFGGTYPCHTGIIHRRRRVTQKSMHKSRIHEVLASGKPAFSKRKWR